MQLPRCLFMKLPSFAHQAILLELAAKFSPVTHPSDLWSLRGARRGKIFFPPVLNNSSIFSTSLTTAAAAESLCGEKKKKKKKPNPTNPSGPPNQTIGSAGRFSQCLFSLLRFPAKVLSETQRSRARQEPRRAQPPVLAPVVQETLPSHAASRDGSTGREVEATR